ncbi:hypothetical protein L1280_002460 [Deinococcus sp. HSC-46F16]|uniref:hypothetical protein n=1 Tax=Deinococcus sp. HSC-46F16 TaxID=2910968 RepID=UPI0020A16BCA|nr:hypothetical protein [Deinococcus sp. HSC-46F16]MCP2015299.1 hypothetical protein [Deinococcus sp. HSC-46F16]
MSQLTMEELASYFFYAQGNEGPYTLHDFVRLIDDLGLGRANEVREDVVRQIAGGRRLPVIRAELVA